MPTARPPFCASLNPRAYVQMFDDRHLNRAATLQEALVPLARAVYAAPFRDFRARLKQVLVADGVFATSRVRAPLMPLTTEQRSSVLKASERTRDAVNRLARLHLGSPPPPPLPHPRESAQRPTFPTPYSPRRLASASSTAFTIFHHPIFLTNPVPGSKGICRFTEPWPYGPKRSSGYTISSSAPGTVLSMK